MKRNLHWYLTLLLFCPAAYAQITTTDICAPPPSATDLVNALVGPEITVSGVTSVGNCLQLGTFSDPSGVVGFTDGVILSTGNIASVAGPNASDATTTSFFPSPGDTDLDTLIPGFPTFDAAVLEFDFECPALSALAFDYAFVSEEYNEFTNSPFNNVFGFFLNGNNIALLPDNVTPVSINNVNGGNPTECSNFLDDDGDGLIDGADPDCSVPGDNIVGENNSNSAFFINNDCSDADGVAACPLNIEADGLTVVLTAIGTINPGVNHIKLGIADAGDSVLDSWVFVQEESFQCVPILDHFKCYEAEGKDIDVAVLLEDQFGDDPEFEVKEPELLCNPVEKNVSGEVTEIRDPTAHAVGYELDAKEEDFTPLDVLISNQFGDQILKVGDPELLLVPSQKNDVPSDLNIDHFKCYEAEGTSLNFLVGLTDQFGETPEVLVAEPELFCNPAIKNQEGGLLNVEAHLACYEIEDGAEDDDEERRVKVSNQFGAQILEVEESELLCVPSEKLDVLAQEAVDDDDDDDDDEDD